jgi:hypothetical protein
MRGDTATEVNVKIEKVVTSHAVLRRPSTFRVEGPYLYAFTADGHAYAMVLHSQRIR